ncbi:MAG: MMPL family transporter [Acetobacteraceae bacterium]|nr:MMPL family transporter [Acetobacteraceae bacterium]
MKPDPARTAAAAGNRPPNGLLARFCTWLVAASCVRPGLVAALALLFGLLAGFAVSQRFQMDTDVGALFPSDLPWRKTERAMSEAFPQREDLIAVVVDGRTGDIAERAAAALAKALEEHPELVRTVQRPDALPFFRQNAFLFLDKAELQETLDRIIAAQPLLGTLAADPSLRGVAQALGLMLQGVEQGETQLSTLGPALHAVDGAAAAAVAGKVEPPDWGTLFTGREAGPMELRRFVLVQPKLDFSALSPGAAAEDAIRDTIARLNLTPEHGVRVRLTGQVPMADEEFATVAEGAVRNTVLSFSLVALLLWLALRSLALIVPVLVTLALGLLLTAAFGVLAIGPYNPLSIAFAVLFIGLGVDFGIQFTVRYRQRRHMLAAAGDDDLDHALTATAGRAGPGILLAALAVAGGFFAFLPTDYRGVSELGAIAGVGMLVAALLSLTVLPALLHLIGPAGEPSGVEFRALAPMEGFLARHARPVSAGLGLLALAAAATLPWLPFDFNPLNLRNPNTEAVATFHDLMRSPETTPNTLDILAPNLEAAQALARRLEALPEVSRAMTLAGFVPDDQEAKLPLIQDASDLLGLSLSPPVVQPPPSDAEVVTALRNLAGSLDKAAQKGSGPAADATRLAAALRQLADGPPEGRARLAQALLPGLEATLRQLSEALQAKPVTLADLPPELVRDWMTPDGRARVEVRPRDLSEDNAVLRRFAAAVQSVAPGATGTATSILASSDTIRHAFLLAGCIALALTLLLLLAALRSLLLALLALAPLVLAGLVTLAICTLFGPALNLANIIALPLLFGIGVAFDIYYVVAWKRGERALLATALTRAVLFSALTTASAFGTLALSSHPGTASMGELLAISLLASLAAVIFGLPALLHAFAEEKG